MSPVRVRLGRLLVALASVLPAACASSGPPATTGAPTGPVTTAPLSNGPGTTGPGPSTAAAPTTTPPSSAAAPTPTVPAGPVDRARVVSRGDPDRRAVALTFDAGADRGFAAEILDTLAAERIRASFGLTGAWAEANPDLVARMAREGHQLVNHTWSHSSFTGVSATPAVRARAARLDELERTDRVIRDLTGRSTRPWFRPPYGDFDDGVNADVAAAGYTFNVLWTVDSLGWQGLSAPAITARSVERTVPGAILLFHVGERSQDAAALPRIVAALRAAGYGFGTVAEIVGG